MFNAAASSPGTCPVSPSMARRPQIEAFAAAHGYPVVSVADIIRYRRQYGS